MTKRRLGPVVITFVLLVGGLSSCTSGSTSPTSIKATKCSKITSCERDARSIGINANMSTLTGKNFRFLTGFVYPRTQSAPWGFRLQYRYLPAGVNLEEDVSPFGKFTCVPIAGIESSVSTPVGRTFCFLPDGANSEARYSENSLLYKLYALPPVSGANVSKIPRILEQAVDALQ